MTRVEQTTPIGELGANREEPPLDDFESVIGTLSIAALWFAVLIAMGIAQGRFPIQWNPLSLSILPPIGHRFGDLTAREFLAGQVWRAVTATFVHYNLLHIALNVIGLYALGRIVESWYGTGPFLAIYVLIAGLGNVIAVIGRRSFGLTLDLHSGGGSGVGFGFITLIAVGGWMSRTRFGDYVRSYMVILLLMNAALCYVLRDSVDNYGHAGGVIAGALVGLAHPYWKRWGRGRAAWTTGAFGVLVLLVCGFAQARFDRSESRVLAVVQKAQAKRAAKIDGIREKMLAEERIIRRHQEVLSILIVMDAFYLELVRRGPNAEAYPAPRDILGRPNSSKKLTPADLPLKKVKELVASQSQRLKDSSTGLANGSTAKDYRRVVELAERALKHAPTPGETASYQRSLIAMVGRVSADNKAAVERYKKLDEEAKKLRAGP